MDVIKQGQLSVTKLGRGLCVDNGRYVGIGFAYM